MKKTQEEVALGASGRAFSVAFWRLPVYTVARAVQLMGTFVTSVVGVATDHVIAPGYPNISVAPDWLTGNLLGACGMTGMHLVAHCQKFVPAKGIKWMLAGIIIIAAPKHAAAFLGYGAALFQSYDPLHCCLLEDYLVLSQSTTGHINISIYQYPSPQYESPQEALHGLYSGS